MKNNYLGYNKQTMMKIEDVKNYLKQGTENRQQHNTFSHVSMNKSILKYGGSYLFSRKERDWIYKNNIDPNFGLIETPEPYTMLRIDLDFKFDDLNTELDLYPITLDAVKQFNKYLKENSIDDYIETISCVLSKPPYIKQEKNKKVKKFGVHIQYPKIFLSKKDFKQFENFFKDKIDGFDCMCGKGWLVYGQQKQDYSGTYTIDYMIDEITHEIKKGDEITDYFKHFYSLGDEEKINTEDLQYKQIFSINLNNRPTDYMKEFKPYFNPIVKEISKDIEKKVNKKNNNLSEEDNIEIARKLLPLLKTERAHDEQSWVEVCWALKSISEDCLELFLEFSKRSDKYHKDSCIHKFNNCKVKEGGLGIGSLYYWARLDSPGLYSLIMVDVNKTIFKDKIETSYIETTQEDLADIFYNIWCEDNLKITSVKDLSCFIWDSKKKLWVEGGKEKLLKKVSNILAPIYTDKKIKLCKKLKEVCEQEGDRSLSFLKYKKEKQIIDSTIKNLKTATFCRNILSFIAGYDIDEDFETKIINRTKHELPIKGGRVINLKTLQVRDRTTEDFWSFECPVNFLGEDTDLTHVIKFFSDISCESKCLIDYHRRLWGYMMTGEISDRSLHIFWGDGCNGKSSVINIVSNILSKFSCSLSEDVMLKKTGRGASPELMDLLTARVGALPESDKREELNSKRVKTITGDDEINARHLFGHNIKFKTQTKPIWATNHKPKINVDDKAILDRLKLIPFLGRFEKTKKNTEYINDLQTNHLSSFFTWFCLGARDWYNGAELIPCKEMTDEMNKYIAENDVVGEFVLDTYDTISKSEYNNLDKLIKKQYRIKKMNVYTHFCMWVDENQRKEDSMGKKEFNKLVEKKLSTTISKGVKYYICQKKETEEELGFSDDNSNLPPM